MMDRFLSAHPKISRRAHNTFPEMALPNAIHVHAGRQGIVRTGDRARKFEAFTRSV